MSKAKVSTSVEETTVVPTVVVETTVPVDFSSLTDEQLYAIIRSRGISANTLAEKEKESKETELKAAKYCFHDLVIPAADVLRLGYDVTKITMVWGETDNQWTIGYIKREERKVFGTESKESSVQVLLRNVDKTYSGRGIFPQWAVEYIQTRIEFELYSAKKVIAICSPKFAEFGETKEDHDNAWKLLRERFPV
jgi:hypothetical protein